MNIINSVIDSIITNQLKGFLSMGSVAGKDYSSVIVKDGAIEIDQLFGRPERLNEMLRKRGIPSTVIVFHIKHAKVKLPWFNWATGYIDITVDEVVLLLHPIDPAEITVGMIRGVRESLILNAMHDFISRSQTKMHAEQKPSMFSRIKAQIIDSFRPKVRNGNAVGCAEQSALGDSCPEWATRQHRWSGDGCQIDPMSNHPSDC